MPLPDRKLQVEHRSAEPLDQHGSAVEVVAQESDAAVAAGHSEHRDLAASGLEVARHDQLQDRRGAIGHRRLGHECLGRGLIGPAHRDRPVAFEVGDQSLEAEDPLIGTHRGRLVAHDRRHALHEK